MAATGSEEAETGPSIADESVPSKNAHESPDLPAVESSSTEAVEVKPEPLFEPNNVDELQENPSASDMLFAQIEEAIDASQDPHPPAPLSIASSSGIPTMGSKPDTDRTEDYLRIYFGSPDIEFQTTVNGAPFDDDMASLTAASIEDLDGAPLESTDMYEETEHRLRMEEDHSQVDKENSQTNGNEVPHDNHELLFAEGTMESAEHANEPEDLPSDRDSEIGNDLIPKERELVEPGNSPSQIVENEEEAAANEEEAGEIVESEIILPVVESSNFGSAEKFDSYEPEIDVQRTNEENSRQRVSMSTEDADNVQGRESKTESHMSPDRMVIGFARYFSSSNSFWRKRISNLSAVGYTALLWTLISSIEWRFLAPMAKLSLFCALNHCRSRWVTVTELPTESWCAPSVYFIEFNSHLVCSSKSMMKQVQNIDRLIKLNKTTCCRPCNSSPMRH